MSRDLFRHLDEPPAYAWVVDADPATAPTERLYRVGAMGPGGAPEELVARLGAGEGVKWRTRYEAGEDPEHNDVVHSGRIVFSDPTVTPAEMSEEGFGPLDDLSYPDCGAVSIEYLMPDGTWLAL